MDIERKGAAKRRLIRRIVFATIALAVVAAGSLALTRLKPAAPPAERSAVWIDTVKRGPMTREVHGLGTLVPEETMLIPAPIDGRIERILVRPGTPVRSNSVVMILANPELLNQTVQAEFALKAAQADYENLRVTLAEGRAEMESAVAQVSADFNSAELQADRDEALAKERLLSDVDAKISRVRADQLGTRFGLEQKRIGMHGQAEEAQLAAQQVKVEQMRAEYGLKKSQVEQLNVRAGFDGVLQQLPAPVEVGQKVTAGTPLGKVAQPSKLKAELKIAETQVKDIAFGQKAVIDMRSGLIEGKVSRIDPSILNGTVTVDVALTGALPPGARPDLSVDGTIELERLNDVVYVGRPVFGQPESTVQLFKLEPDGKNASKVKVQLGRSSVNTIEIRGGLQVGDQVILSDMSQFDSYDRIRLN